MHMPLHSAVELLHGLFKLFNAFNVACYFDRHFASRSAFRFSSSA
jgi:hypothetical protein